MTIFKLNAEFSCESSVSLFSCHSPVLPKFVKLLMTILSNLLFDWDFQSLTNLIQLR